MTGLRPIGVNIYNTLTRRVQPLAASLDGGHRFGWYSCGPTVYDDAHLGHARSYISQDVLRRVLTTYAPPGTTVDLVQNVTDVDDKIIRRARETGAVAADLAAHFEARFFGDMALLGVTPPSRTLRVTDHMEAIVAYARRIEANGFAYRGGRTGSLYFDSTAYNAGRPAGEAPLQLASEEEPDDVQTAALREKRSSLDFCLWKTAPGMASAGDPTASAARPLPGTEQDPLWASPWGPGRPGWHIECSALTAIGFSAGSDGQGLRLDLHTGGRDLEFPHHANERLQCSVHGFHECSSVPAPLDEWCRHFTHYGPLAVSGQKMSKSLKNFITIQEFLGTEDPARRARIFRLMCLMVHYRSDFEVDPQSLAPEAASGDRQSSPGPFDIAAATDRRIQSFIHQTDALLERYGQALRQEVARVMRPSAGALYASSLTAIGAAPVAGAARQLYATACHTRAAIADCLTNQDLDTVRAVRLVGVLIGEANALLSDCMATLGAGTDPVMVAGLSAGLLPRDALDALRQARAVVGEFCHATGLDYDPRAAGPGASMALAGEGHALASAGPILDSAVQLRAATRQGGLRLMKLTRPACESAAEGEALRAAVRSTAGELLAATDRTRDDLRDRAGVAVRDFPNGASSWQRAAEE
ncbi:hypothetical protein H696_02802 [Fonticula alba]|uniref:cysteine--tRNA ligase n=1 Tax=Fonticula alba TaxID=691883 RepID=A0A058Z8S0_FONAL|nr:hypothetical protein H696_02802 [Fonticula alba]KCV70461.1 hypothetical protein H696_02802 [Fonticula alba]|eukprot:XP_009494977.1 hypothetical protein H696_02802 [Fonticula alba]